LNCLLRHSAPGQLPSPRLRNASVDFFYHHLPFSRPFERFSPIKARWQIPISYKFSANVSPESLRALWLSFHLLKLLCPVRKLLCAYCSLFKLPLTRQFARDLFPLWSGRSIDEWLVLRVPFKILLNFLFSYLLLAGGLQRAFLLICSGFFHRGVSPPNVVCDLPLLNNP